MRFVGRGWLAILGRVGLGMLVVVGVGALAAQAFAQYGTTPATPSTVTVIGEGEARGAPDLAFVTVGVQTQAASAAQATEENNRRMAAVLETLRAQGIANTDIQTTGLSVSPDYSQPMPAVMPGPGGTAASRPAGPQEPSGYQASNTVTVTVRQVDRAGALLDAALAASANRIGGIRFGISDTTALHQQALNEAVGKARAKAEPLAAALGLRVVGISSVTEEPTATVFPAAEMAAVRGAASFGGTVPVEPGELKTTARVRVAFQFQ